MRFSGNWASVAVVIWLSAGAPAFASDFVLAREYSPGIDFCPPGLDSLPTGNAVELAEAALACHEQGLIEDMVAFQLAYVAREEVDARLEAAPDSTEKHEAVLHLARQLSNRLEASFDEIDPAIASAAINAFPKVFDWNLQVDGYDPGFPVSEMLNPEEYRQAFRMAVADIYGRAILGIHYAADSEFSELYTELSRSGSGDPGSVRPEAETDALAARMVARQKQIAEAFIADFKPSLIVSRVTEYGVYESSGRIEHFPAEDTADGTRIIAERTDHLETSLLVPADIGIAFGFDYEIAGFIPGTNEHLKMRSIHPPMRNAGGDWQTVSTTSFDVEGWHGRIDNRILYRFSEPHQMLPGEWTLQIIYFDEVLLSKTFQVMAPEMRE